MQMNLLMIDLMIQKEQSFVIESTLSGSFLQKHIKKLKDHGYKVILTFLFLASSDLCIERIRSRVMQGGHDVPHEDAVRRFHRGLINFWGNYRFLVDYYSIYFNYEFYDFKLVAKGFESRLTVIDQPLFKMIISKLKENNNGHK